MTAPVTERVLLIGVSRLFRIKLNKSGGFTIQQMIQRDMAANPAMCEPEPVMVGVNDEVMVWKSVATTPIWQEAIEGMQSMQMDMAQENKRRKRASKLIRG